MNLNKNTTKSILKELVDNNVHCSFTEDMNETSMDFEGVCITDDDITHLLEYTKLTRLEFATCAILGDLSRLKALPNFTSLKIQDSDISNVLAISALTNLQRLVLTENVITDIAPLSSLTSLTELDLGGNEIKDVTPLRGLICLTHLSLFDNFVTNVTPLAGLTNLQMLGLSCNDIKDVTPLANLQVLETLDLDYNLVTDLSPLLNLPRLTDFVYTDYAKTHEAVIKLIHSIIDAPTGKYSLEDLECDPPLLMKAMEEYPNYKRWFITRFPKGAQSRQQVYNELFVDY